jgi:hypothetical protein
MTAHSLFERLARSGDQELEAVFAASVAPEFDSLTGFMWSGFNTDPNLRYIGIRKFIKAFFRAEYGEEGCNVRVAQNPLGSPWLVQRRNGKPNAFAFYLVSAQTPSARLARNPNALLIDYAGSPRNPAYHVERIIRDYLVRPDPSEPDVLLGRAFVGFGRLRFASSFFVLERLGPFAWPQ